jgi:short subunit fatty acids transporter
MIGLGGIDALSSTARQIIFWLLIIAGALLIYKLVNPGSKNTQDIDLTQFDQKIKKQELKQVIVKQTETVAIDKATGIEYHVQLTNEQTKNDILKACRELDSNGKPLAGVVLHSAVPTDFRLLDFHAAANAVGREQSLELRQITSEVAEQSAKARDLQGRRRR